MGRIRRSKRQLAVALEKSMGMYDFEDEMNGVNPKLSLTTPDSTRKGNINNKPAQVSVQKNSASRSQKREIIQKNGKGHLLHLSKSPSFEFFSRKQSKIRKSDSGISMTPSPILKDILNSPVDKARHSVKSRKSGSPQQSHHKKKNHIVGSQLTNVQSQQVEKHSSKAVDYKDQSLLSYSKKENKSKVHTERNLTSPEGQTASIEVDDHIESIKQNKQEIKTLRKSRNSEKKNEKEQTTKERKNISPKKEMCLQQFKHPINVVDGSKPNSKTLKKTRNSLGKEQDEERKQVSKMDVDSDIRMTRSSSKELSTGSIKLHQEGRRSGRLSIQSRKLCSVKNRLSAPRNGIVKKNECLRNSKCSKQYISITKMVKESYRKHKIMTAPTSTPINLRSRTPKGLKDGVDVKAKIDMALHEVSPVLKCGSHGAVVASPSNLSDLGSPRLNANLNSKRTDTPREVVKCKGVDNKSKTSQKKPAVSGESMLKYVCRKETSKRKQPEMEDCEPKKNKTVTQSLAAAKQPSEQEELELSMNLFEYLPEKEAVPKKKLQVAKASPVEVDTSYSPLDISKTYNPSSFTQITGGKYKKKTGRYSTTRLDQWADLKNSEFDQLGSYELSIE